MQSVRSRAVELAADPSNFDFAGPVREYLTPDDAKLEADAYLSIVIDGYVERLVTSLAHRRHFLNGLRLGLSKRYSPGIQNTDIDSGVARDQFVKMFIDTYATPFDIEPHLATPIGQRTEAACLQYANVVNIDANAQATHRSARYLSPPTIIRAGMIASANRLGEAIQDFNKSGLPPEDAPVLLTSHVKHVRGLASVSNDQLIAGIADADIADALSGGVKKGYFSIMLDRCRQQPIYFEVANKDITPHHGCPGMPELPKTDRLYGGSGVGKTYLHGVDLILAANMHALNDDRRKYRIMPKQGLLAMVGDHLRKPLEFVRV